MIKLSDADKTIFNRIARTHFAGFDSFMKTGHPAIVKLEKLGLIIIKGGNTIAVQIGLSKKGKVEFITGVHTGSYRGLGPSDSPVVLDSDDGNSSGSTK